MANQSELRHFGCCKGSVNKNAPDLWSEALAFIPAWRGERYKVVVVVREKGCTGGNLGKDTGVGKFKFAR